MNIVFILGAGASVEGGAPLMSGFLDRAYFQGYGAPDSHKLVFRAVKELERACAKSTIDLQNIESVFTAFEMAELFQKLGDLSPSDIQNLTHSVRQLIVDVLEGSVRFDFHAEDARAPATYEKFVAEVVGLLSCMPYPGSNNVSILTFNYDVALDFAFSHGYPSLSYCFEGIPKVGTSIIPLLKLHGSLNWLRCISCGHISVIPFDVATWSPAARGAHEQFMQLPRSDRKCEKCDNATLETYIVPPSWSKMRYYYQLANVWRVAAAKLSEAEAIGVFGYSLPLTDQWFRHLFALGAIGSARLQKFAVFDPDRTSVVDSRFRDLLGPMVTNRYEYVAELFSEAIEKIGQRFWIKV